MNQSVLSRRDQLLVDGALGTLEGPDQAAFEALLRDPTAAAEFAALERSAAWVAMAEFANAPTPAPTPSPLATRLRDDALAFFAARTNSPQSAIPNRPRPVVRFLAPWFLAAVVTLALSQWWRPRAPQPPELARAELLATASTLVRCEWTPGPSQRRGDVNGDVVWSPTTQAGFLRLSGLPPLGADHCYQLWIVDAARTGPPVDGGRLEPGPAGREFVVPIGAKLPVQQPAAFVLTIEAAGGVVVSAQEHVVAIARP